MTAVDQDRVWRATRDLLAALGCNPDHERFQDTPARVARAWAEFLAPVNHVNSLFEHEQVDQMVVLSGFTVWSMCEHHLLPFSSDMTVAYIPNGHVLGISKLARIARRHAQQITMQERMVKEIADEIEAVVHPVGVAVIARGQHMCLAMRGVRLPALMTTSDLRGAFREDPRARAELLALAK